MNDQLKYGYTITLTPGLIEDGTWPITLAAYREGRLERSCDCTDEIPLWSTQEAAESALRSLVPDGKNPSVYAGARVQLGADYCWAGHHTGVFIDGALAGQTA